LQVGDLVSYNYDEVRNKGISPAEKIGLIIAEKSTSFGMNYRVQWDSGISRWYHSSNLITVNEVGRKPKPIDS